MKCPSCKSENHLVIDSRPSDDTIRRRRRCTDCGHRWTTYEAEAPIDPTQIAELRALARRVVAAAQAVSDGLEGTNR